MTDPMSTSNSQDKLFGHTSFLLNPSSTSTPSDALFAPSSNEALPSTSSSPNEQPPIHMVSLPDTPTKEEPKHVDDGDGEAFDTPRMDEDTVVPETESPFDIEETAANSSETKTAPPRRMNRGRVSFRVSPVEDNNNPTLEKDAMDTDASGSLPESMRVASPAKSPYLDEGENGDVKPMPMLAFLREAVIDDDPDFPRDIFDVVKMVVGDRERRPVENVDILEVARANGISFPAPKWHRPRSDGTNSEVISQPKATLEEMALLVSRRRKFETSSEAK